MFVSFSKTIAKFGGLRFGLRLTKKNSIWVLFLMMFVYICQAMWYMMILCGWMVYAIVYGMIYGIKKLVTSVKQNKEG